MLVTQQDLDQLRAAASRHLRDRWLVVNKGTGEVVARASFCRPRATSPELLVVGVR